MHTIIVFNYRWRGFEHVLFMQTSQASKVV